MNHKFDELAKGLAKSVTRRQALKRFGTGLAGMTLACFGLADRAAAQNKKRTGYCQVQLGFGSNSYTGLCVDPTTCQTGPSPHCDPKKLAPLSNTLACDGFYDSGSPCTF